MIEQNGQRDPSISLVNHSHVICVANRGPFELDLNVTQKTYHRGSGGVVTALIDMAKQMDMIWLAVHNEKSIDREIKNSKTFLYNERILVRYISISHDFYEKYYRICNEALWFIQLALCEATEDNRWLSWIQDAWWNGYVQVNQIIAQAIEQEIERESRPAVILLHDYHLYMVAALIRKNHPSVIIQHFIHIPWPDVQNWQFLPQNIIRTIHRDLLCNDIIGFQTARERSSFLKNVQVLLDDVVVDFEKSVIERGNHRTQVCIYPISISVVEERSAVKTVQGREAIKQLEPFRKQKIIMRADRIDPAKNILRGFQAYEHMFTEHLELLGKVTFLAFLSPSRQSLKIYKEYEASIFEIVEKINVRYSFHSWKPIHIFYDNERVKVLAALQFYDVLLVNSIADGMNLVAKEGPIVNQRNGRLVLSRTAGAFEQLGEASIPISPKDIIETSNALYKALTISRYESRQKFLYLQKIIETQDLKHWLFQQIYDINELIVHKKRA